MHPTASELRNISARVSFQGGDGDRLRLYAEFPGFSNIGRNGPIEQMDIDGPTSPAVKNTVDVPAGE